MVESLAITIIEIIGTVAFAVSGAMTALEKKLDIFGVCVLGSATAIGGGVLRDIVLGNLPPETFKNSTYALISIFVSILIFIFAYINKENFDRVFNKYYDLFNFLDAVGLGTFTVVGVNVAIENGFKNNAFLAIFVGTLTGVGGGVLRDLMANKIPVVLRKRIYALAAIIGAFVYYILYIYVSHKIIAMIVSVVLTILIRVLASVYMWNLPKIYEKINEKENKENDRIDSDIKTH
ncbi:MAG: trimeric intracellular cation channel family protein [Bacillota bacterium]|nr:trimeric intracellular cation channel family protein [Bacillota bacterium]